MSSISHEESAGQILTENALRQTLRRRGYERALFWETAARLVHAAYHSVLVRTDAAANPTAIKIHQAHIIWRESSRTCALTMRKSPDRVRRSWTRRDNQIGRFGIERTLDIEREGGVFASLTMINAQMFQS